MRMVENRSAAKGVFARSACDRTRRPLGRERRDIAAAVDPPAPGPATSAATGDAGTQAAGASTPWPIGGLFGVHAPTRAPRGRRHGCWSRHGVGAVSSGCRRRTVGSRGSPHNKRCLLPNISFGDAGRRAPPCAEALPLDDQGWSGCRGHGPGDTIGAGTKAAAGAGKPLASAAPACTAGGPCRRCGSVYARSVSWRRMPEHACATPFGAAMDGQATQASLRHPDASGPVGQPLNVRPFSSL